MRPDTLAGALLVLVVTSVLAIGGLCLMANETLPGRRLRRIAGVLVVLAVAIYWLSSGLFSSGCC